MHVASLDSRKLRSGRWRVARVAAGTLPAVDLRRLRVQEWIAAAGGVVLLAASFLDWYGGRSAWEAFGALDVVLAIVGLAAIALAVLTAAHSAQAVPLAIGSLLTLVGLVASVWLALNVASPPGDADREAGLWVGFAACVGVTLTALWSVRDDRFPKAVAEAGRVEIPTLPAPPREGAGQPGG